MSWRSRTAALAALVADGVRGRIRRRRSSTSAPGRRRVAPAAAPIATSGPVATAPLRHRSGHDRRRSAPSRPRRRAVSRRSGSARRPDASPPTTARRATCASGSPTRRHCAPQGLMGVTDLSGADGMVFRWDEPTSGAFWMRDTPSPLSIAFYARGRLVRLVRRHGTVPAADARCRVRPLRRGRPVPVRRRGRRRWPAGAVHGPGQPPRPRSPSECPLAPCRAVLDDRSALSSRSLGSSLVARSTHRDTPLSCSGP